MQMQPEAIPQEAGPSQGDALLIPAPVQHSVQQGQAHLLAVFESDTNFHLLLSSGLHQR